MLYKILFILLNALTFNRSSTPPHHASAHQQKRTEIEPKSILGLHERIIGPATACLRVGYWLLCACEIAEIIAYRYPTYEISSQMHAFMDAREASVISSHSVGNVTPTFIVGSVLLIVGANIRLRCFKILGEKFTFTMSLRDSHKLCTSGPYSIVRHPAYTGGMIKLAGAFMTVMFSGSWWLGAKYWTPMGLVLGLNFFLSTVICFYASLRGRKEDEYLRKEFGKQWDEWAKKVPYRYIPGIV